MPPVERRAFAGAFAGPAVGEPDGAGLLFLGLTGGATESLNPLKRDMEAEGTKVLTERSDTAIVVVDPSFICCEEAVGGEATELDIGFALGPEAVFGV